MGALTVAIKIELNEMVAEDVKLIQEMRALGVSEDVIQRAYEETQKRRNEGRENK